MKSRAVSFAPSVMAASTLGRTPDSISKNNSVTPATPTKSTVSKLSAMRSPFQGTKKRKVSDPLQEQIHLIHGGWKPSKSIAAIPKSQMKSPPSLPKVNPATPQNTTATNPKSPSTPLTPTPIITKKTKQMISGLENIIAPSIPAAQNRKISSRWARQNANKGYQPSTKQNTPRIDNMPINSSLESSNEAGALLNLTKGDEATYEALCDYNNQLASDSVRVRAVDEAFDNIQNEREGQNADLPSVEEIMKQLPSGVFATKNEIQGRLKIHWESKS